MKQCDQTNGAAEEVCICYFQLKAFGGDHEWLNVRYMMKLENVEQSKDKASSCHTKLSFAIKARFASLVSSTRPREIGLALIRPDHISKLGFDNHLEFGI